MGVCPMRQRYSCPAFPNGTVGWLTVIRRFLTCFAKLPRLRDFRVIGDEFH